MPQHKSAIKRLRQSEKRKQHNNTRRSKMRTHIKKVLNETDKETAEKYLKEAVSYIDRVSVKGIIHQNNAARKKSKLTNHVNNL
ncbi:30S ribosomal protein S20 [Rhodohalobacter barkolensis]|uniref:Small ribosomal subunit protein bS20 n=1 Tax=Rhodohalobacter barkolensis TaxID=2053187 RepID=A0A2N0VIG2_9BACT|nr:30S ribosomal protein S20 [Rhodohalobacter barkolensis]PKD43981.1 30S ribosomal protein S20 [Rhodohalobacter barkolensis]